jgi:hypothetical protein
MKLASSSGKLRRESALAAGPRTHAVEKPPARTEFAHMNIAQIEKAVERGVPFRLKVADGDEFRVPRSDYIFLPPKSVAKRTYVVVHNDGGFASVLPLLMISSLTYQVDANA